MAYKHFSVEEREAIQNGLWEKRSVRNIARGLGRHHTAVSREIQRNLPPQHFLYTPRLAHERALKKRRRRGREDRLKNSNVREYVVSHLKRRWSPEQIKGRILADLGETISHEAIYQYVYAQVYRNGWGELRPDREDLRPFLRRRRKRRVRKGARRCQMISRSRGPSIDLRPLVVMERSRVGDWEGDTVESRDHKPGINTLVERRTGFLCVTKLGGRTSRDTREAVVHRLRRFPKEARHTLTVDNGPENQAWEDLEAATGLRCFFAHAYCSWERGTNENTNGLLRDYYPKKTDFTTIPEEELAYVEQELNTRPRKRLGWKTPLEVMGGALEG